MRRWLLCVHPGPAARPLRRYSARYGGDGKLYLFAPLPYTWVFVRQVQCVGTKRLRKALFQWMSKA